MASDSSHPHAPCWRFRAMAPSEPNQNPFQGEFFSADLPQRFVRESIQNSLDARAGDDPVRVRFTIGGEANAVAEERARRYLVGMRPHFEAVVRAETAGLAANSGRRRELQRRRKLLKGPLPFLTVEDFGTRGLHGNIRANDIRAEGNDFWGFFRSIGISPKGDDAGGSWGLGKWVFPDASKLNAFLGVTRRAGEPGFLLMGQAMLKIHEIDLLRYPPVGFFAAGSGEDDEEWFPMPVESRQASQGGSAGRGDETGFVRGAMRDFGLRPNGETGTSVVIPHPMDELTVPSNLAYAVIRQYFHPIVAGNLVVEIVAPGRRIRTIDAHTIADEASRTGDRDTDDPEQRAEALVRVISLAEWGLRRQDDDFETADGRRAKPAIPSDRVDRLRERYQDGERLTFHVRCKIRRNLQAPLVANTFRVLLERDDGLATGHDYYVRGHLHIPQMDYLARHRARALVVVDNTTDLGHLLRDAEGPSHERWRADAPRLKEKGWPAAAERVREVQNAAARILDALAEKPKEIQRDALADLFPSGTGKRAGPGGARPRKDPKRPEPGAKSPLRVKRVENGFELTAASGSDVSGQTFDVAMAYDLARHATKTAFSRFEKGLRAGCADFSLRNGRIDVESHQCEVETRSENEVRVRVLGADFSFAVRGFDGRDVVVRIASLDSVSEAAESDSARE